MPNEVIEDNKMFKVKMSAEKLTVYADFNKDGQPSVDLNFYSAEALEETLNLVGGAIKKVFNKED
jgi:hypothetical protein